MLVGDAGWVVVEKKKWWCVVQKNDADECMHVPLAIDDVELVMIDERMCGWNR